MLSSSERLPPGEFPQKGARRIENQYFILKTIPNSLARNRFAFLISKKVDPRSTGRHLLKRIFASTVKKWPPRGEDHLFILKPAIKEINKELIKELLKKTNVSLIQRDTL